MLLSHKSFREHDIQSQNLPSLPAIESHNQPTKSTNNWGQTTAQSEYLPAGSKLNLLTALNKQPIRKF